MVIDTLKNAEKYYSLHPSFKAAFEYLNSTDLTGLEVGKYVTPEGLKAGVTENEGKTAEVAAEKFECHNKHIDIQVVISGYESFGWKPREGCTQPKGEYNDEKDVLFYADAPEMHFSLLDSQFVIFYPEDVHAPMIGTGPIKKMVVKVPR
jgi:biofilm protein TabA